MRLSWKLENPNTPSQRANALETTWVSFLASFKATSNKLGQKKTLAAMFQRHCALCDVTQIAN